MLAEADPVFVVPECEEPPEFPDGVEPFDSGGGVCGAGGVGIVAGANGSQICDGSIFPPMINGDLYSTASPLTKVCSMQNAASWTSPCAMYPPMSSP
ncbi:hypothetical protein D3C87_1640610 [compost metagenome]